MKPVHRKLLFFLFVALFLVSAPLLVLFTAGYRYNVLSGRVVRTGVLSVTTVPRGAEIFLNERTTKKTTPYVVKQLVPGTYSVLLLRDGYHAWFGEVDVQSGATTLLQHVLLLQNEPPLLVAEPLGANLSPSPDGTEVAYAIAEGGWIEIWLYSVRTDTQVMLNRFVGNAPDAMRMEWSADGGYLLVENQTDGILAVFGRDGASTPIDAADTQGLDTAFWHPDTDELLYLATATELRQVDVREQTVTVLDDPHAASVILDASVLTLIDNGTNVELRQSIGEDDTLIALLPRASYEIALRDGGYLVLTSDRGRLYLLNIRETTPLLLEADATLFDWLPEKNQLAYSDGYELNVYDPLTHTTEFLTRQGEHILSLSWHESGQVILVASQTKLTAVERYQIAKRRTTTELLQGNIEAFWTTTDGSTAYIHGTVGEQTGLFELPLTH